MNRGITDKNLFDFLTLSEHLTGFCKSELLATGMLESYYYVLLKEPDQQNVKDFFIEVETLLKEASNDETLRKAISTRLMPDNQYENLAQRIILLWYTGIWTSGSSSPASPSYQLSAESFKQSLAWSVAQTHPAGAKQPGFASWEESPL